MARITKLSISFCALLITLPWTPLTQASEHARHSAIQKAQKAHDGKVVPKHSSKNSGSHTSKSTSSSHKATPSKKHATSSERQPKKTASGKSLTKHAAERKEKGKLVKHEVRTETVWTEQCTKARKGHKKHCTKVKTTRTVALNPVHKAKVQKAQKTAMSKLMNQIGKPYHWGGTSPRTGFDCSGLVYYAYKDLVKFPIPRTANEMYHLRDAAPVERSSLQSGDLVFFRTQGRGTADHVGVYIGNGKFIQSPRSGQDIQVTSLSEDYWQRHYVGARRVVTPKTLR